MSRLISIVVILVIIQTVLAVQGNTQLSQEEIEKLQKIGKEIKDQLSDKDPCVDFHAYVCDKYNMTVLPHLQGGGDISDVIENYLQNTKILSTAEGKFKAFIETCKKYKDDDVKKFVREFNFVQSIGGWPVFEPDWKGDKFDWQTAMAELETYTVSVIVNQRFTIAPITFKKHLRVVPEDFDLTRSDDKKEKLLKKMSTVGLQNVDELINSAAQFEKECEEVISAHKSSKGKEDDTNFAGLKQKIPEIDWDKQMEITIGKKLEEDFAVVIVEGDILKAVIEKISKMDPKIVANYFFCSFVYNLPDISEKDLKDQCMRHAGTSFRTLVFGIIMKKYFTENTNVLLPGIVQSVIQDLHKFAHSLEGKTAPDITKIIEQFINDEYLPSFSDESLNKKYENVEIDPNCFYQNFYKLRKIEKRLAMQLLLFTLNDNLNSYIEILYVMSINSHMASKQPSFLAYITTTLMPIMGHLQDLGPKVITSFRSKCISKLLQIDDLMDEQLLGVIAPRIFAKSYFDWANKNEDLVRAEDEVLKEYDLSSRKISLIHLGQYACEFHDPAANERTKVYFWSMDQFINAFNCPADSPMNPIKKCDNNA